VRAQSPADYFQGRDVWDTQAVPVYISPAGPASVTLLASSDTGPSSGDGVTNLNNTAGKTLRFQVEGVAEGADVVLYADGHEIGRQTASGASVIVETNGTFTLTEGRHDIWAVQILRNEPVDIGNEHSHVDLSSTASSPTTIIVDTAAPLITSYAVTDAAEGRAYLYDVDSTEEADGGVTYRLTQSPAGMSIDDMAAGRIVWTPAQGQAGTWPVTVRVTDKAGNYNEQQFQATVTPAPTVVGIPAGNVLVDEGQALTLPLGATGSDARRPFVFSLGSDAPQGAAINAQTGEFSWQPSEAQGPGLYQITVRVTDNLGAVGTGTLRVRVAELNQPPVIGAIEDRTVDEGELIQFNVPVTDADLPANALRFSLADGAPAGASIDPLTGRFTWAPSELQGGQSFSITVRVTDRADPTDSTALQDEATFNVTVREVDSPPVFSPLETLVVMPGDQVRVQFHVRGQLHLR